MLFRSNGIKSVVAGSYVVINTEDGSFSSYDYFSHIYKKVGRTKEEIFKLSQERLEAGFQRMLGSLKKNQPLLIPLSGGYDSRLIACLCKKSGLENVTCFTYGREDSFEVAISKKVASALGYKCILSNIRKKYGIVSCRVKISYNIAILPVI